MARISEDKNFFFDVIFALYKMREINLDHVKVLFIGDIISITLYNDMVKLSHLLDVSDSVDFTKKSIRFSELSPIDQDGYFLNFTIGNFKGYSGIESIKFGFKSIFYNVDKKLNDSITTQVTQCSNIQSLLKLISKIQDNRASTDLLIREENSLMKNDFLLNYEDRYFLKTILL